MKPNVFYAIQLSILIMKITTTLDTATSSPHLDTETEIRQLSKHVKRQAYICNHDLKKSYSTVRFDFLLKKPIRATEEMKAVCPNMDMSCCSVREMETLRWIFDSYFSLVEFYFAEMNRGFSKMSQINEVDFLKNLKSIMQTSQGKCINKVYKEEFDEVILNLPKDSTKISDRYYQLLLRIRTFYSGFINTLCNPEHQSKIIINSNQKMEIKVDLTLCQGLFQMKSLHYEITKKVFAFQRVTNTLTCLYTDNSLNQTMLENMEVDVDKEILANDKCLYSSNSNLDSLLDQGCLKRCQDKFHFKRYINSNDFLALNAIIRKILKYFNRGTYSISQKQAQFLNNMFKNSNNPYFYRRVFDFWPPVMNSVYTRDDYIAKITYDGINFFDDYVRPIQKFSVIPNEHFEMILSRKFATVLVNTLGFLMLVFF